MRAARYFFVDTPFYGSTIGSGTRLRRIQHVAIRLKSFSADLRPVGGGRRRQFWKRTLISNHIRSTLTGIDANIVLGWRLRDISFLTTHRLGRTVFSSVRQTALNATLPPRMRREMVPSALLSQ